MTPSAETPATPAVEPSLADIKAYFAETPAPKSAEVVVVAAEEPKTITPETTVAEPEKTAAEEQVTEAAPGPAKVEEPETPVEEEELELPPNVVKKIAKETAKQAGIQRQIDEAVSARKAKQAELDALAATGKSGSEPAPTTAPAKASDKPVRPKLEDYANEADPYAALDAATTVWQDAHDAWLIAETERTVEHRITEGHRKEEAKRLWDEAIEKHGDEFPELMDRLAANSPADLQLAISGLDNWSTVSVHLAKSPDELKAIAKQWKQNPYAAVAALGKLEDRLTKKAEPPPTPAPKAALKKEDKPLPPPPAKVGGGPSAIADIDVQTVGMREFKRAMLPIVGG